MEQGRCVWCQRPNPPPHDCATPPRRAGAISRRAHFAVSGRLGVARPVPGTMTVDLGSRTIRVRPARRRKVYELPMDHVAEWICHRVSVYDAAQLRAERKAARLARRR
jgi:hypothetical protein